MPDNLSNTVSAVQLTVAAPGTVSALRKVDPGVDLEFTNDSNLYPNFEIEFVGPSPASADDNLAGTIDQPVIIHVPDQPAVYAYNVKHKKKDGTYIRTGTFAFSVSTCDGC